MIHTLRKLERKHFISIDYIRNVLNNIVDTILSNILDDLIVEDFCCEDECVPIEFEEGII